MSTDLYVYFPELQADLLPRITARLAEFGMDCTIEPDFRLEDETHNGFLPIKVKMLSVGPAAWRGKEYLTGFECVLSDFSYVDEIKKIQNPPKPNFVQKLLFKTSQPIARKFIADQDTDDILKRCNKVFTINYHHSGEMISNAFAAVLAELTSGLVYDPQDDEYLLPQSALAEISALIEDPLSYSESELDQAD
ncbi:hypothetical protein BH11CYA1_BH11CYA1_01470 [soil metagenome]